MRTTGQNAGRPNTKSSAGSTTAIRCSRPSFSRLWPPSRNPAWSGWSYWERARCGKPFTNSWRVVVASQTNRVLITPWAGPGYRNNGSRFRRKGQPETKWTGSNPTQDITKAIRTAWPNTGSAGFGFLRPPPKRKAARSLFQPTKTFQSSDADGKFASIVDRDRFGRAADGDQPIQLLDCLLGSCPSGNGLRACRGPLW
jgi:hypothetical protein